MSLAEKVFIKNLVIPTFALGHLAINGMNIMVNMKLLLEALLAKVLSMHILTSLTLIADLFLLNQPAADGRKGRTRLSLHSLFSEILFQLLVLLILQIFDQKPTHLVGRLVDDTPLLQG
jgi:hypothetical protein